MKFSDNLFILRKASLTKLEAGKYLGSQVSCLSSLGHKFLFQQGFDPRSPVFSLIPQTPKFKSLFFF